MTAYSISTGADVFYDTLAAPSVSATLDTYALSAGSRLVLRTDSNACANHSVAAGSLDKVTFSGAGGTLHFDPLYVRVIAYTAGSGNSPAFGAAISQGGVSGVFLGAWANWQSECAVPGAALPATGFIKVGGKVGGSFASGALTGLTATCSGPDVQGWIEVRGADTATITVPRIGKVTSNKAWFELGVTSGVRGQILPCPTTATYAGAWPGIWIETAPGSGVYEKFVGAGSQVALATTRTTAEMKLFKQTTAGIVIGNDGTNGVYFLPPAGCKVRIPAVIWTNCTRTASGSGPRVLPNATIATRQELVTNGAGFFDLQGIVSQWYMNFSQAFYTRIKDCAINDALILSEVASPLDVTDCVVSPTQAQLNTAVQITSCFAGGQVANNAFWRFSLAAAGNYVATINYPANIAFSGNVYGSLTLRANSTTGCISSAQAKGCSFTGETLIGGRGLFNAAQGCSFNGGAYYDHTVTTTTSAINPMSLWELAAGSSGNIVDGVLLPQPALGPYTALVSVANSYNTTVQELGTDYDTPLALTAAVTGLGVNSTGNNDGVYVKRMYLSNTRTGPYVFVNSDNNIVIENCAGDAADTTVMAGLNAVEKNVQLTASTTGQVSVYGTHWKTRFTSATAGFAEVVCNEPTGQSAPQCFASGGSPQFNSSGSVLLTKVGDQVTWEMPFFAVGYTAFTNSAPTITGTNVTYSAGARWGNHDLEFQVDTGSGYGGTWLALTAANLAARTFTDTTGFKLKIRATCAVANAGNLITNMRAAMTTTAAARKATLYPMVVAPLSISGCVTGSIVKFSRADNGSVLYSSAEVGGVASHASNDYLGAVNIEVRKSSSAPYYIPYVTQVTPVSGQTTSAAALQQLDE